MNLSITKGTLTFLNGILTISDSGVVTYASSTEGGTVTQPGNSSKASPIWLFTTNDTPAKVYNFNGTQQTDGSYQGKVSGPPKATDDTDDWQATANAEEEVEEAKGEKDIYKASAS